jgi:uncharacterized protein with GYD domain
MEEDMPTFILTINWTDQGIRAVRDAPKRSQAARELAKKVNVRTRTSRAWTEPEWTKLMSELP